MNFPSDDTQHTNTLISIFRHVVFVPFSLVAGPLPPPLLVVGPLEKNFFLRLP